MPEREEDRADLSLDDERVSRGVETTSQVPQALLAEVADRDSYNWGYDPVHYLVPEGSYASEPDGVARIVEMREMVEAIHEVRRGHATWPSDRWVASRRVCA